MEKPQGEPGPSEPPHEGAPATRLCSALSGRKGPGPAGSLQRSAPCWPRSQSGRKSRGPFLQNRTKPNKVGGERAMPRRMRPSCGENAPLSAPGRKTGSPEPSPGSCLRVRPTRLWGALGAGVGAGPGPSRVPTARPAAGEDLWSEATRHAAAVLSPGEPRGRRLSSAPPPRPHHAPL